MSDVPQGWRAISYGDVLSETHERRGDQVDLPVLSVTKTQGPMLASERFGKALHSRDLAKYRVARRGTIVVDPMLLWDGAIGRQEVVDAGLVSPDYRVYELADHVYSTFMRYVVRNPRMLRHYQGGARGTNVRRNRIARQDFLRIPFRLPPLPEQRKIAAILSTVDEVIEKTEAVIESLETLKAAMMHELLTRGLPGRHTRFKQTEIGEIPEAWAVTTIGTVFDIQLGKMLNRAARDGTSQFPYLANRNVQWGRVVLDELNTMGFEKDERTKFRLMPGDVLICEGGEVGRTAIWRGELFDCYFQKAIHRLRPRTGYRDQVIREYVPHFMRHAVRSGFLSHLTSQSSIAHLTREKLMRAVIALPPVEEQTKIASALDGVDDHVQAETSHVSAMRALQAALMSALLTGELRVTLDEDAA